MQRTRDIVRRVHTGTAQYARASPPHAQTTNRMVGSNMRSHALRHPVRQNPPRSYRYGSKQRLSHMPGLPHPRMSCRAASDKKGG